MTEVLAAITKAVDEADGSGVSMAQLLGILGMSRALDVESAIDEVGDALADMRRAAVTGCYRCWEWERSTKKTANSSVYKGAFEL